MNPVLRKLAPDEILFREGDSQTSFFFIRQGVISLFRLRDGKSIELSRLSQNTLVGDVGYFAPQNRATNAKAVTECELIEFRFEDITAGMKSLPPWASLMLRNMGDRIQQNLKLQKPESDSHGFSIDEVLRGSLITRAALLTLKPDPGGEWSWEAVRSYAFQTFNFPLLKLEPVVRALSDRGWLDLNLKNNEIVGLRSTSEKLARIAQLEEFIRNARHANRSAHLEINETDEILLRALVLAGSATNIRPHHNGSVAVSLENALAQAHGLSGGERIRADQFDLLTGRGIDLQKQSSEIGIMIAFQLAESRELLENWVFLLSLLKRPS